MPWQNVVSVVLRIALAGIAVFTVGVSIYAGGPAALLAFTVQSNLMLAVSFAWTAWTLIRDTRTPPEWLAGSAVFYIVITGVVFNFVLSPGSFGDGQDLLFGLNNSQLAHAVVPIGALVVWVLFAEHRRIPWGYVVKWLVYVVAYIALLFGAIAVGADAPYPFLDVDELGWGAALANVALYLAWFFALSAAVVGIDKALPARGPLSEFDRHDQRASGLRVGRENVESV